MCNEVLKTGSKCRAPVMRNSKFCFFHNKQISEKHKKEARSLGGKSKIIRIKNYKKIEIKSISDLKDFLIDVLTGVMNNSIDVRASSGIAYLSNTIIRIFELSDISIRLEKIEKALNNNNLNN